MVGVKVIAEKGVEYKVWKKEGKHRIYFTLREGMGKPIEIGNYDLIENKFFSDRKYSGEHWDMVEQKDNPQALIIIADEKKIFVGPSKGTATFGTKTAPRKNDSVQERITLGMCINNATAIVAGRINNDKLGMGDSNVVQNIYDLADKLLEEYKTRYS
jgi:hypothetical protein|tara:strand:- start:4404 stop:4877 length:474 start_codon:yes stop_codon:yes gene_type:complete